MKDKLLRVPKALRPASAMVKSVIRGLVYFRLSWFPLSVKSGEAWAKRIKTAPAVFYPPEFCQQVLLDRKIRMNLGLIDIIERNLLLTGTWDQIISRSLQVLLKSGDTFIDVGANIGYFTLLASSICGSNGTVIAVEPSRRALLKLLANLELNDPSNITVLSVAAGSDSELYKLGLSSGSNIGATNLRVSENPVCFERIAIMPLGGLLSTMDVKPSLIKIDIEGWELHALYGLEDVITKSYPKILLELTDSFLQEEGQSAKMLIRFMNKLGYQCYELSMSSELIARAIHPDLLNIPLKQVEVLFAKADCPLPSDFCVQH